MSLQPLDDDLPIEPGNASAPPKRQRGVRSRAGNAMGRTRAAVLDGAVAAVQANGARKTTMADIAAQSGIAKGTLYNHFRTKEAVFAATVDGAVERLADEATAVAADQGLAAALTVIIGRLADSGALQRLHEEPAALLPLLSLGDSPAWKGAREALAGVFAAAGARTDDAAVELGLRWTVSFAAGPIGHDIDTQAGLIAAALMLPAAPAADPPVSPVASPTGWTG